MGRPGARGVIDARFGHVSIVARDWRALASFYERVFGCVVVPPERDFSGPELSAGVGVPNAALRGVHLRLPGLGADGPTLEIFEYAEQLDAPPPAANRRGFTHIAFAVADVAAAGSAVLSSGGHVVGDIVTLEVAGGRRVTFTYVSDPEGNILELQSWTG